MLLPAPERLVEMAKLLPLVIMVVLFYALLIRPQRRQLAAHQDLVSTLAEGDDVITAGGLYGRIRSLDDISCQVEVTEGVVVRVARNAIRGKVSD